MLTYTAVDHKYIDLNWLYQLAMYSVYSLAGSKGLIFLNSLFIVVSVFLLIKRSSKSFSPMLKWLLLIALLAVSPSLEIRPHSLSWVFLGLTLFALEKYWEGNKKMLRLLPVIMILWVNCHSLFILGLVIMGCYGVSIFINQKKDFKEYAIMASLATVACLINPYGWNGFSLPFEQMMAFSDANVYKMHIRELQSPFSITDYKISIKNLFSSWHFFDLFVIAFFIGIAKQFKKLEIHEWLLCIIFFYFAYSLTKNIGYCVIAITPIIAKGFMLNTNIKKAKSNLSKLTQYIKMPPALVFILVCVLLIFSIRSDAFYIHYRSSYRFGLDWEISNVPVNATAFLNENKIKGKMLNQLDLGGYLEFFSDNKTSMDGRLEVFGQKMFSEQVITTTDEAKNNLLEKLNPDFILFSYYLTPDWIVYLQKQASWRLVHVDECTAIYFKENFEPEFIPVDESIFTSTLSVYTDEDIDAIAKNKIRPSVFSSLVTTQYFPEDELNKAVFCFFYGWINAAKQITASGLEKSSKIYPELYQNLGSIYYQLKDKDRSLFYYEKFLETSTNKQISERVQSLRRM